MAAAIVFVVVAVSAAYRETPTVDEYAHVPAGHAHWRHGDLELMRSDPPLSKLWVALPSAFDSAVVVPDYEGGGTEWEPWHYGERFERENKDRYLSLMARARLMTVPLILVTGAIMFFWGRRLYGAFAAGLAATLFFLSPTILAHGHLATADASSMAAIVAAAFAVQWYVDRRTWYTAIVAGAALGLALGVTFSALYLAILLPVLIVLATWQPFLRAARLRSLAGHMALYVLATWLTLNASFGFVGTFQPAGGLRPQSESMRALVGRVPPDLPLALPAAFIYGIDAIEVELERGLPRSYQRGKWSTEGWTSYYPLAFAIKESELVVVLTVLSLLALPVVVRDWRLLAVLLVPPVAFVILATVQPWRSPGLRTVLPVLPFVFVMLGSVFAWIETHVLAMSAKEQKHHSGRIDRRWYLAVPVCALALLVPVLFHPAYLSYFNQFVGGPSRGHDWLIDADLDRGQDLYRLPSVAREENIDSWRLLYFGHVDPAQYDIRYELPSVQPESAVYAVSANYYKGLNRPQLSDGKALDQPELEWLMSLVPTRWAGSIAIFDLRDAALKELEPETDFNAGVVHLVRGEFPLAATRLARAVRHDPRHAEAYHYLAMAYLRLGQKAAAVSSMRTALHLRPDWDVALNNLAWELVTSDDPAIRNVPDGVRMAERAVEANDRKNLIFLHTLATAYAAADRWDGAVAIAQEGLQKAEAADHTQAAEGFRQMLEGYRQKAVSAEQSLGTDPASSKSN